MRTFNTVIDSDVVSLLDASGKVICVSASSDQVLGHFREDLVGQNALDLVHPEDLGYTGRALRQVVAKPLSTCQIEVRVRRKDLGMVDGRMQSHKPSR